MKKIISIALLTLALLVGLRWGYTKFGEVMRAKHMASAMIPSVRLATVEEADVATTLESPGRVVAFYDVDVYTRVPGFLQKQYFTDGSYVKKGDVLMLIEPQEYVLAVQRAQAALQSAKAEAAKAEKDYLRAKELVEKDYIPKSTYDSTTAQRDVARAQVANAQAALNDAKRNHSYTRITATVSGKISNIQISEGNFVTPQSGALANIVSVDPIFVQYSIDSKQLNQLKTEGVLPGANSAQPVKVEIILPDNTVYKHQGVADFLGNQISRSTGTLDMRATFKNDEGILIPGDFVKVITHSNITTKKTVVPQAFVLQDPGGKYVFVVDENGKGKRTPIETGAQEGENWVVESGLKPGDAIVGEGALKVVDGYPVKIISDEEWEKLQKEEEERKQEGAQ
ncbi:multidrug efflux pump membrane-fusion protein AcrA [Candidatus Gastranaerophilus sp. (ex Termes propinquus)]|nr:multidrug efflux pump membrane-fusion protein AcrA [Candidatus Gastranaerophilus sp. (ex Termes propinquus)]